MARAVTFITVLLGLWITGCAVRPSREEVRQLLETEVTPRHARPIAEASRSRNLEPALREAAPVEAGAAFLAGESAEYPHCDGLPHNGSHVIDTSRIFNTSCTWHGNPGLQVTLKETLTFQGNLVLKGEIQIMGKQELEGPCINVNRKMTVIAANASFVGCRNRMQDGKGGALFIQRDFIVSNSGVKFENCRAQEGGGLYTGCSFLQEAESTVIFENCTAFGSGGGGARVNESFTQERNSSAIFRSCSAQYHGGGLYTDGSFLQEAESTVTFENCTSSSGGGADVKKDFTQGRNSSAIFRSCSAGADGGGLLTDGSFLQEAESTVTFENCTSSHGGGARVSKNFTQGRNSSAIFRSCSAPNSGGGLLTDGSFLQEAESTVTFENCTSSLGGGARVNENFTQGRNSSAIFRSCSARYSGGGLYTDGSFLQEAESTVTFENCTSSSGGGADVSSNFAQGPNSSAIFRSCSAGADGGGLLTDGSFLQEAESTVTFENCTSSHGGGARVNENFTQGRNSSAIFRSCSAGDGGGLLTYGSFLQEAESTVTFENCRSSGVGGGAHVKENFTQGRNCSAIFRSCSAQYHGGGLYTSGSFLQEAESTVTFENCTAFSQDGGGAFVMENFTQGRNSSAIFRSCSASEDGGCLYAGSSLSQEAESTVTFENCTASHGLGGGAQVHEDFTQGPKSSAIFRSCRAESDGGGLTANGRFRQEAESSAFFENCSAYHDGGGARVGNFTQGTNSSAIFRSCSASGAGGGLHASSGYEQEAGSSVLFEHCSADRDGGGVVTEGLNGNGSMRFKACRAAAGGGLRITIGGAVRHGGSITFEACNASSIGGGLYMDAGQGQFGKLLLDRCDAHVLAAAFAAIAADGTEAEVRIEELSLSRGSKSNVNDVAVSGLLKLGPAHLTTESSSGIYISARNLSLEDVMNCTSTSSCTFNANAATSAVFLCPSGAGSVAFEDLHDFGCLACRPGDTQVLNVTSRPCSQCPEGASKCLASELEMEPGLMVELEDVNRSFHCPNEAASGQGSLRSASSQCLLSYLGYEKTLWGSHLLDVVVAAGLISSLSLMKDFRVALIAGMNCFLPTIAADFGKYLVCYRLRRDDAAGLQGLHCPFLPGSAGLASATQVVAGFILFMVAALWTWLSLSRSDEDPKPSHVVFLTSKYQRRYALFETERLIRKTLFTFIGALLPIDSSPALQMGCLGIVVSVSLFLYCRYKPYHSPEWNWIEICLLFAATVMITSVSTLLANEFHWGHSVPTQQSIIFATAGIAAVASAIMVFRVIQELVREQRHAAK